MNVLNDTGVYYTQNAVELPISERIFFRKAVGQKATTENFRPATSAELEAWEQYKSEQRAIYENMKTR